MKGVAKSYPLPQQALFSLKYILKALAIWVTHCASECDNNEFILPPTSWFLAVTIILAVEKFLREFWSLVDKVSFTFLPLTRRFPTKLLFSIKCV